MAFVIKDKVREVSELVANNFMRQIEESLDTCPDDPVLKGCIAKAVLQLSTLMLLKSWTHPNSQFDKIVDEYLEDIKWVMKGED